MKQFERLQKSSPVIVAGSRSIKSMETVDYAITQSPFTIELLVRGAARGVDRLAEQWAKDHEIPYIGVPARWEDEGNRAGMIRNGAMASVADGLVAVWDGQSPGTKNMIEQAHEAGMIVYVLNTSNRTEKINKTR